MNYFYELIARSYKYGERQLCIQPMNKDWGPVWYQRACFLDKEWKEVPWNFTMRKVIPLEDGVLYITLAQEDNMSIEIQ